LLAPEVNCSQVPLFNTKIQRLSAVRRESARWSISFVVVRGGEALMFRLLSCRCGGGDNRHNNAGRFRSGLTKNALMNKGKNTSTGGEARAFQNYSIKRRFRWLALLVVIWLAIPITSLAAVVWSEGFEEGVGDWSIEG